MVPSLLWKNLPPELKHGEDPKETFIEGDKGRQQHHRVGREVMRLKVVELEEGTEEPARRKAEAAQAVRAKDNPLALLRCRRNFLLRRSTDPHEALAGQASRLAEELDVVLMDVGAIPRA